MNRLVLVIRGHVRNSFDTNVLYNFVKDLSSVFNIMIYIHTWNVKQTSMSWRKIQQDDTKITEDVLKEYFKDLYKYVQHVIIDDDKNIELNGETNGLLAKTKTSLLGWKRCVYGQYRILKHVRGIFARETVVNTRFDLFSNSYVFTYDEVLNFVINSYGKRPTQNMFLRPGMYCGVDNVIVGTAETTFALANYLHHNLDHLVSVNPDVVHPEFFTVLADEVV